MTDIENEPDRHHFNVGAALPLRHVGLVHPLTDHHISREVPGGAWTTRDMTPGDHEVRLHLEVGLARQTGIGEVEDIEELSHQSQGAPADIAIECNSRSHGSP